jgi:hypothetical protein
MRSLYARNSRADCSLDGAGRWNRSGNKGITQRLTSAGFGSGGAVEYRSRQFPGRDMRLMSVRNTWLDLDAVEKAAVMLAFVALTLAAWVLGTMIVP